MATPQRSQVESGVAFPVTDGGRSTLATGRGILSVAAGAIDSRLAHDVLAERDWRKGYIEHFRGLVEAELRTADPDAAPRAGLAALHASFEFLRDDQAVPLADACKLPPAARLHTHELRGSGRHGPLSVPYRGRTLQGDALRAQLERWAAVGTVEPSFAEAIGRVLDEPDWLDLSGLTVVVLGAGAEMGPVAALNRWGATLVPIDLPRRTLWARILGQVGQGSGRMLLPTRRPLPPDAGYDEVADAAGIDLITGVPEVAAWLGELEGPLVLGNYVYADGSDHVRAALAADALAAHLLLHHDGVTLAGLLTPTDVYAAPSEVVEESRRRFDDERRLRLLLRTATQGRTFAPNYARTVTSPDGRSFGLADGLIPQQGPNYALAKRLQQWRFRLAREQGVHVSANIAPASRTRSVTSNRILAAAYAGSGRFDVEVFEPATSTVLLAALLVHDLRSPAAAGRPGVTLRHPTDLFSQAAAHGGLWRQPYAPRSVLPLAAASGLLRVRR